MVEPRIKRVLEVDPDVEVTVCSGVFKFKVKPFPSFKVSDVFKDFIFTPPVLVATMVYTTISPTSFMVLELTSWTCAVLDTLSLDSKSNSVFV